jgi:hypothetical protein
MLTDFNQAIIPQYSPISSKGGSKRRRKLRIRKLRTRRHKKSNKSRTRRRYR